MKLNRRWALLLLPLIVVGVVVQRGLWPVKKTVPTPQMVKKISCPYYPG